MHTEYMHIFILYLKFKAPPGGSFNEMEERNNESKNIKQNFLLQTKKKGYFSKAKLDLLVDIAF